MAYINEKAISRKEFIKKTFTGALGLGLFKNSFNRKVIGDTSGHRVLGRTGIKVIPVLPKTR